MLLVAKRLSQPSRIARSPCNPFHSILLYSTCGQLDRLELQAALLLYMKSLARVIPTVVAHELKDMGELVNIDSNQVQEEIVSVVDEVGACYRRHKYVHFSVVAVLPGSHFSLGTLPLDGLFILSSGTRDGLTGGKLA